MNQEDESKSQKITFKKVQRKNFRSRIPSQDEESEEEDNGSLLENLQESKEIQKFRRKQGGLSLESLLVGKKEPTKQDDDPFKTKTGGMVDMAAIKNATKVDDAYDTGIGTAFSAETNRRDEDAEMQKFIEEQLLKKRGTKKVEETKEENKYLSPEEAALRSVPDFLRESHALKNEEMLSNQMLNGIPEVDLGIAAKIRNIEATENAKQTVISESLKRKERPSEFVLKNMAVNFAQHQRYSIYTDGNTKSRQQQHKSSRAPDKDAVVVEPVVGGGVKISATLPKEPKAEKATDDYHYERFKKHARRV